MDSLKRVADVRRLPPKVGLPVDNPTGTSADDEGGSNHLCTGRRDGKGSVAPSAAPPADCQMPSLESIYARVRCRQSSQSASQSASEQPTPSRAESTVEGVTVPKHSGKPPRSEQEASDENSFAAKRKLVAMAKARAEAVLAASSRANQQRVETQQRLREREERRRSKAKVFTVTNVNTTPFPSSLRELMEEDGYFFHSSSPYLDEDDEEDADGNSEANTGKEAVGASDACRSASPVGTVEPRHPSAKNGTPATPFPMPARHGDDNDGGGSSMGRPAAGADTDPAWSGTLPAVPPLTSSSLPVLWSSNKGHCPPDELASQLAYRLSAVAALHCADKEKLSPRLSRTSSTKQSRTSSKASLPDRTGGGSGGGGGPPRSNGSSRRLRRKQRDSHGVVVNSCIQNDASRHGSGGGGGGNRQPRQHSPLLWQSTAPSSSTSYCPDARDPPPLYDSHASSSCLGHGSPGGPHSPDAFVDCVNTDSVLATHLPGHAAVPATTTTTTTARFATSHEQIGAMPPVPSLIGIPGQFHEQGFSDADRLPQIDYRHVADSMPAPVLREVFNRYMDFLSASGQGTRECAVDLSSGELMSQLQIVQRVLQAVLLFQCGRVEGSAAQMLLLLQQEHQQGLPAQQSGDGVGCGSGAANAAASAEVATQTQIDALADQMRYMEGLIAEGEAANAYRRQYFSGARFNWDAVLAFLPEPPPLAVVAVSPRARRRTEQRQWSRLLRDIAGDGGAFPFAFSSSANRALRWWPPNHQGPSQETRQLQQRTLATGQQQLSDFRDGLMDLYERLDGREQSCPALCGTPLPRHAASAAAAAAARGKTEAHHASPLPPPPAFLAGQRRTLLVNAAWRAGLLLRWNVANRHYVAPYYERPDNVVGKGSLLPGGEGGAEWGGPWLGPVARVRVGQRVGALATARGGEGGCAASVTAVPLASSLAGRAGLRVGAARSASVPPISAVLQQHLERRAARLQNQSAPQRGEDAVATVAVTSTGSTATAATNSATEHVLHHHPRYRNSGNPAADAFTHSEASQAPSEHSPGYSFLVVPKQAATPAADELSYAHHHALVRHQPPSHHQKTATPHRDHHHQGSSSASLTDLPLQATATAEEKKPHANHREQHHAQRSARSLASGVSCGMEAHHNEMPLIVEDFAGVCHVFCPHGSSAAATAMPTALLQGWLEHRHGGRLPMAGAAEGEEEEAAAKERLRGASYVCGSHVPHATTTTRHTDSSSNVGTRKVRPLALHITEEQLPWLAKQLTPEEGGLTHLQELYCALDEDEMRKREELRVAWSWVKRTLATRESLLVWSVAPRAPACGRSKLAQQVASRLSTTLPTSVAAPQADEAGLDAASIRTSSSLTTSSASRPTSSSSSPSSFASSFALGPDEHLAARTTVAGDTTSTNGGIPATVNPTNSFRTNTSCCSDSAPTAPPPPPPPPPVPLSDAHPRMLSEADRQHRALQQWEPPQHPLLLPPPQPIGQQPPAPLVMPLSPSLVTARTTNTSLPCGWSPQSAESWLTLDSTRDSLDATRGGAGAVNGLAKLPLPRLADWGLPNQMMLPSTRAEAAHPSPAAAAGTIGEEQHAALPYGHTRDQPNPTATTRLAVAGGGSGRRLRQRKPHCRFSLRKNCLTGILECPSLQMVDVHHVSFTTLKQLLPLRNLATCSKQGRRGEDMGSAEDGSPHDAADEATLMVPCRAGLKDIYATVGNRDAANAPAVATSGSLSSQPLEIVLDGDLLPSMEVLWLDAPRIREVRLAGPLHALRELHLLLDLTFLSSSLVGLEQSPNLQVLHLEHVLLDDLSFLGNSKSLRELLLHSCRVSILNSNGSNGGSSSPLAGVERAPSLQLLSLAYTLDIKDVTHFAACRSLKKVVLTRCNGISTASIAGLHRLPELEVLSLEFTRVSSVTDFAACSSLTTLRLDGCKRILRSSILGLEMGESLRELSLSGTNVITVANLGAGCSLIASLDLSDCAHLDVAGLQGIQGMRCLEVLNLSRTPLTDLHFLADCPALVSLYVEGCDTLDGDALDGLQHTPLLKRLVLDYCTTITEAGRFLRHSPRLQALSLAHCTKLTDRSVEGLEEISSLQYLDLSGCTRITTARFLSRGCRRLRVLKLGGCVELTCRAIEGLRELPELVDLELDDLPKLTDANVLADSPSLRRLSLRNCSALTYDGIRRLLGTQWSLFL